MGLTVDSYLLPTSKSRDTKTKIKIKIMPRKVLGVPPNLIIRGHLPAPVINGGGDSPWKWSNFRLSWARDLDLDLGSCHTAYHHASFGDLYLHTKFHWNQRNFLWRTDGRTDGHLIWDQLMLQCNRKHFKFGMHVEHSKPQPTYEKPSLKFVMHVDHSKS